MINRILLVAAVAGLAIIIGFSGQLIINDVSEGGLSKCQNPGVEPLIMISHVDEKFARTIPF